MCLKSQVTNGAGCDAASANMRRKNVRSCRQVGTVDQRGKGSVSG